MEGGIPSVMARIEDIEARIASLSPAREEKIKPEALPVVPAPVGKSFPTLLAQVGGNLQIRPLGTGAGPFEPQVESLIAKYAAANHVNPEMVRAVVQQESGGNAKAVSAAGAQGLMQLMPQTAAGFGVSNPFDPEQNIAAGTRYLAGLLREFGGSEDLALAAYNAGPAAVKKAGGVPHFQETQDYVRRIKAMMAR